MIIREMTELLVQDMVRKNVVSKQMVLTIGYDRESLTIAIPGKTLKDTVYAVAKTNKPYQGKVTPDPYGRPIPYPAHGTAHLERYSNSVSRIAAAVDNLYERIADKDLLIRRVTIAACGLIAESEIPEEPPEQLSFFTDYAAKEKQREADRQGEEKERKVLRTILSLQDKFGKNAVLRGMNLLEGGTTIERNSQIGGHKA